MKIKFINDRRTYQEMTGYKLETTDNGTPVHTEFDETQIKPRPEHHVFDIELTKPFTPKQCLVWWLFRNFEQWKRYKMPEFSVNAFLNHHEVTKADIPTIKKLCFSIGHAYGFEKADALRPEILQLLEFYSFEQNEPKDGTGFDCNLNDHKLKKLFDVLRRNDNYIDNLTPWDHFRAAFRPDPLPPDFAPIRWTIAFVLLSELINRGLRINDNAIWIKLTSLFVDKDGKHKCPRSAASAYSQSRYSPTNIDNIVKQIT
jgi:hypothetical protein